MSLMMVLNVVWFVFSYGATEGAEKDYTLGRFVINGSIMLIGFLGFLCTIHIRKDFICYLIILLYIFI